MDLSLDGRVAIVTGGGTGIGAGISLGLAEAGANIVVVGRRPQPLEESSAAIRALGRTAVAAPTDITDGEQVKRLVRQVHDQFGRIDILVNNAGGSRGRNYNRGPLLELSETDFDGAYATNVKAVFVLSKEVAPVMLAQEKGVILNIGSGAGRQDTPLPDTLGMYGPSKAAMLRMTIAMATEWGPHIRVIAVNPGIVVTPVSSYGNNPARGAAAAEGIMMGRLGLPGDFAGIAAFLASDTASWITGTVIDVNGGLKSALPALSSGGLPPELRNP